jgi:hypothetical protein
MDEQKIINAGFLKAIEVLTQVMDRKAGARDWLVEVAQDVLLSTAEWVSFGKAEEEAGPTS